ncbi:hypothetical protein METBIDRAFT_179699 [Metschnikowia bicuspidata var. bicuspidata NRRL YB-4993]|uniref:Required for respiratory growth protein 7, mitochondrial n=1 Tax=Metschnikowia bicuspidata var. bicuspidata NRRL YB-4993 TaxID=869754 RepID=A0A1A0HBB7_9ASCO|nr:hypothetical protein METBIDRAFT_179699 [Metschnikowia bicuspidata var. bicuspidata NRRL YB-4993]OBA21306.1 hypothetical protein METBIDRAFT_179699 [Metschnikowia bicuspidata var. bicuspidata NRRL YB-4993]
MLRFLPRRGLATLKEVQSCQEYLDFCRLKGTPMNSTVFRGTLYELTAKALLEQSLHFSDLVRSGGAGDNGLDLYGRWDLSHYRPADGAIRKPPASSLLLACKPFSAQNNALDLRQDVVVLVQCKNHRVKIKAATIRELAGIREFHINMTSKTERRKTFMVLVSPLPMTKQGTQQMDTSDVPMLHAQVSPLEAPLVPGPGDFCLQKWKGGVLGPVYLNFSARTLLQGLSVECKLGEVVR